MCYAYREAENNEWLKKYNNQIKKKYQIAREKETFKYLEILGADTIKKAEKKEFVLNILEEENYLK